jgi:hypothetical protein
MWGLSIYWVCLAGAGSAGGQGYSGFGWGTTTVSGYGGGEGLRVGYLGRFSRGSGSRSGGAGQCRAGGAQKDTDCTDLHGAVRDLTHAEGGEKLVIRMACEPTNDDK